jgi:hypothetical protein
MNLAWVGWTGYGSDVVYEELKLIKACDMFTVGTIKPWQKEKGEKIQTYAEVKSLFERLKKYDVIIHDSYGHSIGHHQNIQQFIEMPIWEYDEWHNLKAKMVLLDTESDAGGQIEWYRRIYKYFNAVLTSNKELSPIVFTRGFSPLNMPETILDYKSRCIRLSMTGSNMNAPYRVALNERLKKHGVVNIGLTAEAHQWFEILKNSKNYYATLASPGTEPAMFGAKGKVYETAYMGCRPIVESTHCNDFYDMAIIDDGSDIEDKLNAEYDPETLKDWARAHRWASVWTEAFKKLI